jgi:hypothetical protein
MLKFRSYQLTRLLALAALGLLAANCAVLLAKALGYGHLGGLVPLFDLDQEKNLPTFFSTLLAILASGLLLVIGLARRQMARPWKMWASLSVVFLLVGLDEFIGMHEELSEPLRDLLDTQGLLYFAWILPYGLLVMLLAGIYGHFVFEMPIHIRNGLLLSAMVFLAGALDFEMLGDQFLEYRQLAESPLYGALTTMEESLEMAGMIIFIHTLIRYIEDVQKNILIQLGMHDPLERIISETQKPLPQSIFRMDDNSNRAER